MTTRLPLFPLGVVLFPGASLALHVFEPRYRQMLADCLAADSRFGILYQDEAQPEDAIPVGTIGCIAEIGQHEPLSDGRSNITVRGRDRFAFAGWADADTPYRTGFVEPCTDVPENPASLALLNGRVRLLFGRVAEAARRIADDGSAPPELPNDPAALSFAVAALIDIAPHDRQALLSERSAAERLRTLEEVLEPAAVALEERAGIHERSKSNGHGPHDA